MQEWKQVWKQFFAFTYGQTDGRGNSSKSLGYRPFSGGTLAGCGKEQNLLRQANISETVKSQPKKILQSSRILAYASEAIRITSFFNESDYRIQ